MEAGLWQDIANLYQPDLRNISGPYDRAYGMDMESYVSVDGVWMRTVLDAKNAPLPVISAADGSRRGCMVCFPSCSAGYAYSRRRVEEDDFV